MISGTDKDRVTSYRPQEIAEELTTVAQSYITEHPDSENGYQMKALVYKQLGMLDEQKEILQKAVSQPFAAPRCALMLADIEFRERNYDKSLQNFAKAIAESNKMETEVHNGYLYVMSALCKIKSAKQKNADLNATEVLDIYRDFNKALSYADNLKANFKDILSRNTAYLIDRYNVPIPAKDKKLSAFIENKEVK